MERSKWFLNGKNLDRKEGLRTSWSIHGLIGSIMINLVFTWSAIPKIGTFPNGTLISGFRCIDPNTSSRGAEEHSAKCICDGDRCEWDRDLPVCTTHGKTSPGYSWLMTASPIEGSICVSVNTGGVGIVANQSCLIAMSNEVRVVNSNIN